MATKPTMWCPFCEGYQVRSVVPYIENSPGPRIWLGPEQNFSLKDEPDVQFYKRLRLCRGCRLVLPTAELDYSSVKELARLRAENESQRKRIVELEKALKDRTSLATTCTGTRKSRKRGLVVEA